MKVKLLPPSGTELAPFNPLLPPASISQILLLANPAKVRTGTQQNVHLNVTRENVRAFPKKAYLSSQEKVRLRYKLTFTLGDRLCDEAGEVDQFPLPETWGHL